MQFSFEEFNNSDGEEEQSYEKEQSSEKEFFFPIPLKPVSNYI